jgi:hypothetical protein
LTFHRFATLGDASRRFQPLSAGATQGRRGKAGAQISTEARGREEEPTRPSLAFARPPVEGGMQNSLAGERGSSSQNKHLGRL